MALPTLVVHRIISPLYDQPLYNSQVAELGMTSLTFFNSKGISPSNLERGALPYPMQQTIKRIALFNSCSNLQGYQEIIRKGTFYLDFGVSRVLELPAATLAWANLKEINAVLKSISKLPSEQQLLIIKNLRLANGHPLEKILELVPQQNIRAVLDFDSVKLSRPVAITCILGGIQQRGISC